MAEIFGIIGWDMTIQYFILGWGKNQSNKFDDKDGVCDSCLDCYSLVVSFNGKFRDKINYLLIACNFQMLITGNGVFVNISIKDL